MSGNSRLVIRWVCFDWRGKWRGLLFARIYIFQAPSASQYGQEEIISLFVPANDFRVDAWLHSRMAVLRGVENGYSLVRSARQGRLTISNGLGQVLAEASTSAGNQAVLVGRLPAGHGGSFYARTGNWFGLINLGLAVYFLWRVRMNRKSIAAQH